MTRTKAFTMLEVLIVITIVSILATILFPVFSQSKLSAAKADSMNNLRQCYVALSLYTEEAHSWTDLPSKQEAIKLLGTQITYDKADTWRSSNEPSPYEVMIGSYAYVNTNMCYSQDWTPCVPLYGARGNELFPLLVSIFYADQKIPPGDYVNLTKDNITGVTMPTKNLTLWTDGHVKLEKVSDKDPSGTILLSWGALFNLIFHGR